MSFYFVAALITLEIAHFVAEFTGFSTSEMLEAKRHGSALLPIFRHAVINGLFKVLAIYIIITPSTYAIMATMMLETSTHFIIDLAKGRITKRLPEAEDKNKRLYWTIFGIDQGLHHIVIFLVLFLATL